MKKLLLLPLLIIAFSSCKETEEEEYTGPAELETEWKWIYSSGGFTGNDMVSPASGETISIMFQHNGTYLRKTNGVVTQQGVYTVANTVSMLDSITYPAIFLDGSAPYNALLIYELAPTVLRLGDNHTEPYGHLYHRM